jgi:hypothetical protein
VSRDEHATRGEDATEPTPTSEGASFRPPFISPRDTGRWAIALLLLTIGLAWIAVGVDLSKLRLVYQATHGNAVPPDLRVAQFMTEGWLMWTQLVLFCATGIAFVMWLFQARVNLRALGVRRPTYGRQWCVWGFLIPAINFFRPYQVLREIWQASDPGGRDAFQWRDRPVPALLRFWWISFVASISLRLLALLTDLGAGVSLPKLQLSVGMLTLADLAAGLSAGLACFVVTRLSETQETKWELQADAAAT